MGPSPTRVDIDGLACVLYVCEERAVAEHVHRALIADKNPVRIKASRVIIHVLIYLVKACAWRGLRVVVVFVVGLGVVFCFSFSLVCFVVDVHTWYTCRRTIDSLHEDFWAASFIIQFLLFVLYEGAWPAVVDELAALVAYDAFVNLCWSFAVSLLVVLRKCQVIVPLYWPSLHWTGFGLPFQHQVICRCHRCSVLVPSFWHIVFHFASQSVLSAWWILDEDHRLHFFRHDFSCFLCVCRSCSIHVMFEPSVLLSSDIIVLSSNQIPHSFFFSTCTLLKNFSRYLSGV